MLEPIVLDNLSVGLVDGPDEHAIPRGGFVKSEGFEYRRGYPRSVYGREKLTSSAIITSNRVRDVVRWVRADGTERYYSLIYGLIWEGTAPTAFATHRNGLSLDYDPNGGAARSVTASRSSLVITFSGTKPKALLTAKVGDLFYYDADGFVDAGAITSVDSDTQITLGSYAGTATSGAWTLLRKLSIGADSNLLIAGDRLWVFDGTKRPHWYDGTHFREAGLPAPASRPSIVLAAGGSLTAGDYFWEYAYEDGDGRIGAVVTTGKYTAAASDKCTLAAFVNGPAWATKVHVYRSLVDGDTAYSITPNVTAKLKTSTYSDPSSTLTLDDDAAALVTGMHVDRYVKFATSETLYLITANDTTTLTVTGDASSATGGESGTDYITITGGFDIDQVVAGSVIDLVADTEVDLDHAAPTHNTQPPTGLMYGHLFLGGGRMCAYKDGTQTQVYFSGRSTLAEVPVGEGTAGMGEFDYWHTSHYAGRQEGDEIKGFVSIGNRTFALKEQSVWELFQESDDVVEYSWFPRSTTVGCLAPRSIVSKHGVAYWLGHDSEETDVVRFDGNVAKGMFRSIDYRLGGPRLRATLDSISATNIAEATGAIFEGRLYISFPTSATNNKTLRFDFKTFTLDIQPWGCGVFADPYYDATDGFMLLCGAPTSTGFVYKVLGTQADDGSSIVRELIAGRLSFPGVPTKARWAEVFLRVVHGEALTTAPVISYSVDDLPFDSGSKTWETTLYGDTWPTTIGEHTVRKRFEVGEFKKSVMFKITSTDAKKWGVKALEVRASQVDQHHSLA